MVVVAERSSSFGRHFPYSSIQGRLPSLLVVPECIIDNSPETSLCYCNLPQVLDPDLAGLDTDDRGTSPAYLVSSSSSYQYPLNPKPCVSPTPQKQRPSIPVALGSRSSSRCRNAPSRQSRSPQSHPSNLRPHLPHSFSVCARTGDGRLCRSSSACFRTRWAWWSGILK